ncbi:hypothetical protein B0A58_02770 [Flavobacterium branchiophilum NBRC 15030 = ATCC 35035]|uniref:DUF4280 domain-containing protein n=1 Tax=Flavobacterium branchiophilum TaxID=55197 RepID=A0A2H3KPN9_9FLAO|nr:DUF4280 domain-containing protein [Flavobacterium branchiophilum]OXA80102.1 hypothetical protein B0A58_02770 [Flavobacterium branchiophilum NBRC 15030 = ATCC 35035]PDS23303.1 DUF4280 domain-containing protein [Flavobacterium branchiophilum]TQM40162.1 uncharacterized protein DUF4280 [Flavobacterium branchiophilum]GEM54939.1 hypothetical protein FB1_11600 [Flavobacterium branchiophilum NBRC 15030 = ATCC 35035]
MAEKHIVVQGATCVCKHSEDPSKTDVLKVKTHSKHYANDKDGAEKLIATTKEIGQTLEANTFGKCKLQPMGSSYKPCQAVITEWSAFYDKVTLSNQGKILLEDSKATCPIGGPDCITIKNHGQIAEVSQQNIKNADKKVLAELLPGFDFEDLEEKVFLIKKV